MNITIIGLDLAKTVFHLVGILLVNLVQKGSMA